MVSTGDQLCRAPATRARGEKHRGWRLPCPSNAVREHCPRYDFQGHGKVSLPLDRGPALGRSKNLTHQSPGCSGSASHRRRVTSATPVVRNGEPEQRSDCAGGCRGIMRDRPITRRPNTSARPSLERILSVAIRATAMPRFRPGMEHDQRSTPMVPDNAECAGGGRRSGSRARHRRSLPDIAPDHWQLPASRRAKCRI